MLRFVHVTLRCGKTGRGSDWLAKLRCSQAFYNVVLRRMKYTRSSLLVERRSAYSSQIRNIYMLEWKIAVLLIKFLKQVVTRKHLLLQAMAIYKKVDASNLGDNVDKDTKPPSSPSNPSSQSY